MSYEESNVLPAANNKNIEHQYLSEFFVIDSDNLDSVKTALYGYCILNDGFITSKTRESDFTPTGVGVYVWVRDETVNGIIRIEQDFNGSFGLYIFQADGYFALSNSFVLLLDHIKKRYPISLNKDFCNYLLVADLCAIAYTETPVREIQVLPKNAVVTINKKTASIDISYKDYRENSVWINSEEGIKLLDRWALRWINCIRYIYECGGNITADLSGGIDSRLVFILLLRAGIPLNDVYIKSLQDSLHTHAEDYEIASEIAASCGLALNHTSRKTVGRRYCTRDEILGMSFITKLGFHKQMYYKYWENTDAVFNINGAGGECVRKYWDMTPEGYLDRELSRCKNYSSAIKSELENSVKIILRSAFASIKNKFNISDDGSKALTYNLYRETRCRNHFGKQAVEAYLSNNIQLQPLMDPELHVLRLNDPVCEDENMLISVIFARYAPELLEFRFDGGRFIEPQTIAYAKKISQKYPLHLDFYMPVVSAWKPDDKQERGSAEGRRITTGEVEQYLGEIFTKLPFRKTFESYFGEEIYWNIKADMSKRKYFPLSNAYPAFAACKIINDINCSKSLKYNFVTDYFTELAAVEPDIEDDISELLRVAKEIMFARIDIKNSAEKGNDLKIESISDKSAAISAPTWFANNGRGLVIQSYKGYIALTVRCIHDGQLVVKLLGRDVRDQNGVRIPKWIDYTELKINGKNVFNGVRAAWHDKPYLYTCQCRNGEMFLIQAWWRPSIR